MKTIGSTIETLLLATVLATCAAVCGRSGDPNSGMETVLLALSQLPTPPLTFQAFKAQAYHETFQGAQTGVLIVDGDTPAYGQARLRRLYDEYLSAYGQTHFSAVYNVNGADIVWS